MNATLPSKQLQDKFYEAFSKLSEGATGEGAEQKQINNYLQFIDKAASQLLKQLQKQGHTPNTAYYTLVKLLEMFYKDLGMPNPQVYLPRPGVQSKSNDEVPE
jgi:hypothetical protein